MKFSLPVWKITLLISLFITIFGNFSFWQKLTTLVSYKEEPLLLLGFFIILLTLTNLLLTLISFKPIFKIIAIIILLTSASAAYFMDNYATMIDKTMIRNILATDIHEATELFSVRLFITILLLGVLPSWLLYKTKINYQPILKGLLQKTVVVVISLSVIAGILYSNYLEYSFFARNNREVRHLLNPENYIFSLKSIITSSLSDGKIVVKPIGVDAKKTSPLNQRDKPSLVILVLGETARAMNFSLNGYERDTNPLLAKQDIINFTDVTSCGTATAVSVPCMFSKFTRDNFSNTKGKQYQNLFDVIKHADYEVIWRDNNTGCQGTCERIKYEYLVKKGSPEFCKKGNCVDEVLLDNLQAITNKKTGDILIILHQKGNHGPTYHRRYPKRFEVFKPVCKTNQLRKCSKQEIVNAYDNAILYTDYFLSKTIDYLKQTTDKYNTAMVYISDHGESLGENNLYLHGLPYMIAPDYQKKVPFLLWLSDGYQSNFGLDKQCIAKKSTNKLSHDNLFSSMLGLLKIQTTVYDKKLDIFASCNKSP